MKQHLGVATGAEGEAAALEALAQGLVVVDFAVEDDAERAVIGSHRLRARLGGVDDRQPAMGEADAPIGRNPRAGAVGTAHAHRVSDFDELPLVNGRRTRAVGKDCNDTAH